MTIIMSCVISYIWISLITTVNALFIRSNIVNNPLIMSGLSIILSTMFACILAKCFNSTKFKNWMVAHFHHTPNEDIWLDVLDFENGSNLKVYVKDKDYYVIGNYRCYEEKGQDSWLALSGYGKFSIENNEEIKPSYLNDKNVIITFRFSDIEHIEIF